MLELFRDLSGHQKALLFLLKLSSWTSIKRLAQIFDIFTSHLCNGFNSLRKLGLISVSRDFKDDKRLRTYSLTEKGNQLINELIQKAHPISKKGKRFRIKVVSEKTSEAFVQANNEQSAIKKALNKNNMKGEKTLKEEVKFVEQVEEVE